MHSGVRQRGNCLAVRPGGGQSPAEVSSGRGCEQSLLRDPRESLGRKPARRGPLHVCPAPAGEGAGLGRGLSAEGVAWAGLPAGAARRGGAIASAARAPRAACHLLFWSLVLVKRGKKKVRSITGEQKKEEDLKTLLVEGLTTDLENSGLINLFYACVESECCFQI